MTDADTIKGRLREQLSALRAEVDAVSASPGNAGPDQGSRQKIADLERQIGEIEDKLERIALAEEMERQKDA